MREKRLAFKKWQKNKRDEEKRIHVETRRDAKRAVAAAKTAAWKEWN